MKKIYLSGKKGKGKFALVNEDKFEELSRYNWHLNGQGYASSGIKGRIIRMHRFILNIPKETEVDHINHNRLDNRKENLRFATRSQNNWNRSLNKNNTSGYKGVSWNKKVGKWESRIRVFGKRFNLGFFGDVIGGATSYNEAAKKYFGEFANLNECKGGAHKCLTMSPAQQT